MRKQLLTAGATSAISAGMFYGAGELLEQWEVLPKLGNGVAAVHASAGALSGGINSAFPG